MSPLFVIAAVISILLGTYLIYVVRNADEF